MSTQAAPTPTAPPVAERARMRLLLSCPDRPGVVHAVSELLLSLGANLASAEQYARDDRLFLRVEFTTPSAERDAVPARFAAAVGTPFDMEWRIADAARPKRMAILVSRYDHCLQDLLWRWRRRELHAEPVLVVSNHADLEADVAAYGLPYVHIPVTRDDKPRAEAELLATLAGTCELVVLARYMQILSGDFLARVGVPVINIHHSFLPAFAGADPYERAKERGVKLVGATAHYVTEELDAGPIIEQDVVRVSHRDDIATLKRLGADIERAVLTRAVQRHCEDRVLRDGKSTVVL